MATGEVLLSQSADVGGVCGESELVDGVGTAFIGELLNVNAFDQEGVELGKKFTFGLMGRAGYEAFQEQFSRYERKRGGLGS